MKRAIIFYNGDLSDVTRAKHYIKPTDYIICADGGARHMVNLNLKPDLIIGDFDSLTEDQQIFFTHYGTEFLRYNKEKDETDSELAASYALNKGYKTIIIFGVFGSRIDHMLTNILALEPLFNKGADATIIEGKKEIRVINSHIKLHGKKGDLLSLIPLKGTVKNVQTKNLYYSLNDEDLSFGYSRGISNVFTAKIAEVTIQEGTLLVIHEKK